MSNPTGQNAGPPPFNSQNSPISQEKEDQIAHLRARIEELERMVNLLAERTQSSGSQPTQSSRWHSKEEKTVGKKEGNSDAAPTPRRPHHMVIHPPPQQRPAQKDADRLDRGAYQVDVSATPYTKLNIKRHHHPMPADFTGSQSYFDQHPQVAYPDLSVADKTTVLKALEYSQQKCEAHRQEILRSHWKAARNTDYVDLLEHSVERQKETELTLRRDLAKSRAQFTALSDDIASEADYYRGWHESSSQWEQLYKTGLEDAAFESKRREVEAFHTAWNIQERRKLGLEDIDGTQEVIQKMGEAFGDNVRNYPIQTGPYCQSNLLWLGHPTEELQSYSKEIREGYYGIVMDRWFKKVPASRPDVAIPEVLPFNAFDSSIVRHGRAGMYGAQEPSVSDVRGSLRGLPKPSEE